MIREKKKLRTKAARKRQEKFETGGFRSRSWKNKTGGKQENRGGRGEKRSQKTKKRSGYIVKVQINAARRGGNCRPSDLEWVLRVGRGANEKVK